jgi:hypothetical protein
MDQQSDRSSLDLVSELPSGRQAIVNTELHLEVEIVRQMLRLEKRGSEVWLKISFGVMLNVNGSEKTVALACW